MAASDIPDMAGRAQAIAKRYAFHANATKKFGFCGFTIQRSSYIFTCS